MTVVPPFSGEVHEAAKWFPMIQGAEFDRLVESIRDEGLDEPIWLSQEGVLLDGRNRLRACQAAGVEPRWQLYDGDDEVAFIIRRNLDRRHLNERQRSMIAARRHDRPVGNHSESDKFITYAQAAEELNVSVPSVRHGKTVLQEGDETLIAAVDAGAVAVSTAATIAELPKKEQRELIDAGDEKAIIAKANEIKRSKRQRRQEERERKRAEAVERSKGIDVPGCDLRVGDFREVLADLRDVDAVITDPPYPREFLPLLDDLAEWAQLALKPDGLMAVMIGQSYLPEVYARLDGRLPYLWTMAYLTPGGQAVQIWERKVNTFWKPILLYGTTAEWFGDVAKSDINDNDKRHHHWGQSVSGMLDLVRRLVPSGSHIADPFLGAGTTAVAAMRHGCRFTGADIGDEHVDTTRARLVEEAAA